MIIFAAEIGALLLFVLLVFIFGKPDVEDIEKSPLNKYQLWCVGLSGVLTCLNSGKYYSLEIDKKNNKRITAYKNLLETSWDVTNKNDLLNTLDWLLADGHNSEYEEYVSWIENFKDKSNQDLIDKYDLDEQTLEFVRNYCNDFKNILAWDYGRYVFLCRAGYLVGYLNKEEALELIEKLGHLAKDKFNSWEEFGENYSIGRKFWAYSDGPEESQKLYEKSMTACKEMSAETGAWSKVMWSWSELSQ